MMKAGLVGDYSLFINEKVPHHPDVCLTGLYCPSYSPGSENDHPENLPDLKFLHWERLLESSDAIIFMEGKPGYAQLIFDALKRSKHILLCNPFFMTPGDVADLIKLSDEAQTSVLPVLQERTDPLIKYLAPLIGHPALLEFRLMVPGSKSKGKKLITEEISRIADAMFFLCPSNIRKIYASGPVALINGNSPVSARIEFENGTVCGLLISDVTAIEHFTVEIFQCNSRIKADITGSLIEMVTAGDPDNPVTTKINLPQSRSGRLFDELELFIQSINGTRDSGYDVYQLYRIAELGMRIGHKSGYFQDNG